MTAIFIINLLLGFYWPIGDGSTPAMITGTFGEPRPDGVYPPSRFHSGVDIKNNSRNGCSLRVYGVEDYYEDRIKIIDNTECYIITTWHIYHHIHPDTSLRPGMLVDDMTYLGRTIRWPNNRNKSHLHFTSSGVSYYINSNSLGNGSETNPLDPSLPIYYRFEDLYHDTTKPKIGSVIFYADGLTSQFTSSRYYKNSLPANTPMDILVVANERTAYHFNNSSYKTYNTNGVYKLGYGIYNGTTTYNLLFRQDPVYWDVNYVYTRRGNYIVTNTMNGNGSFSLSPGIYTLYVLAIDEQGNEACKNVNITVTQRGTGNELTGLPCSGSGELLITENAEQPKWVNTNELIFHSQDSSQYNRIYAINIDSMGPICLTPIDDVDRLYPNYSSYNGYLTYQRDNRIAVLPYNGGDEIILTDEIFDSEYPKWIPGGDWIVYQKFDQSNCIQIYKVSLSSGEEIRLTDDSYDNYIPTPSPCGNFIFFIREDERQNNQLWRMNSDGVEKTQITFGDNDCESFTISPDGNWIVFQKMDENCNGCQLYKISSNGGDEIQITNVDDYACVNPNFSPDGENVVFTLFNGEIISQICKTSVNGGEIDALTPCDALRDYPQVSPCGNWVIYEKSDTGYTRYDTKDLYKTKLNTLGIDKHDSNKIKYHFHLNQSYPNPSNNKIIINYSIPIEINVSLNVYNNSGKIVGTLVNGIYQPGQYNVIWKINNVSQLEIPNGVYFYRLEAGEYSATKKMVILR